MPDPTRYTPDYSFTGFQATNPTQPLPAVRVDDELANIKIAIDSLIGASKDLRRSDGALKNELVTYDTLSPGLKLSFKRGFEPIKLPVLSFATREELRTAAAAQIGVATHVHILRYHADGPPANMIYELYTAATPPAAGTRDFNGTAVRTGATRTAFSVSALNDAGVTVTKYARLVSDRPTPFMFGAYGNAADMGHTLAQLAANKAAVVGGERDDFDALQDHVEYMRDGETWWDGGRGLNFAVSAKLNIYQRRLTIDFGTIVPFGAYSDYLTDIAQVFLPGGRAYVGQADPTAINVSRSALVRKLWVCGRWQSRGARFSNFYMSEVHGFRPSHVFGTVLKLNDCYENHWFNVKTFLNRDRVSTDVSGATLWNSTTVYTVGQVVRPPLPNATNVGNLATGQIYNAAAAYNKNDLVYNAASTGVFRALRNMAANAHTLTPNGPDWVRDEVQWYRANLPSQNAYPLSASPNYTTNQNPPVAPAQDLRIWERVFPSEPLFDFCNKSATHVVDHQYFWGGGVRDSSSKEFMRWDGDFSARPTVAMELHAFHFEGMTPGVPNAASVTGIATAADVFGTEAEARANATLLRIAHAWRCKLVNVTFRCGGQGTTALRLGSQHPLDIVSELTLDGCDINGEDNFQIGIYVGTGIQETINIGGLGNVYQNIGNASMALLGTGALKVVDPAERLYNAGNLVPNRAVPGSLQRPSYSFQSDPTAGIYSSLAGQVDIVSSSVVRASFGPALSLLEAPTFRCGVLVNRQANAIASGDVAVEFTTNTTLKLYGKGTDNVVRSVTLTLT